MAERQPDESRICAMSPTSYAAYCADTVNYFYSMLLSEGNFIFRADAHMLPIVHPAIVKPGSFGAWKSGEHKHFCLLGRFLVDNREQLEKDLEELRPDALEQLKASKARWLGGVRIYASMNMDRFLFDIGLVIPFWEEEKTLKPKSKPKPKAKKKAKKKKAKRRKGGGS